jgi:hypothetical protein
MNKTIITMVKIELADFTMDQYDFAEIVSQDEHCYRIKYNDEIGFINKSDENIKYKITDLIFTNKTRDLRITTRNRI